MKSLLISYIFPPQTGGSGRWFWEIYRRWPREQVVVAAAHSPGAEEFDRGHELNVSRVPLTLADWGQFSLAGLWGYRRAFRAVHQIARRERIDQVHCGALLPDGWLGWLLRQRRGLPYVVFMHGEEPSYACSSRQLGWMAGRVLRGAALIVANSRNTRRIVRETWQIPDERIRVLNPGVDCQRFQPAQRDPAVRRQLGWGERPVILTAGRLQERKGHDMLIRALPAIRQVIPDVLYAIAGDGDRRQPLVELARSLDVEEQVQFCGEVADEELIRRYQQCDLFVLPNRQIGEDIEGFGMVLLEAQACGRPVVAGDSGGTAETMKVSETGQIVDCRSPEPLADVIGQLLRDPQRRARMGTAGRRWAVEQFDWSSLAARAGKLLNDEAVSR